MRQKNRLRVMHDRPGLTPMARAAMALTAMALTGGLVGCTVGPDYHAPDSKVSASFKENDTASTQPSVTTPSKVEVIEWWSTFRDPQLNALIARALKGNLTVRQSASRLRQARLAEAIAGAAQFPDVTADGGEQHARGSKNVKIPASLFSSGGSGGGGAGGGSSGGASSSGGRTGSSSLSRGPTIRPADTSGGGTASGGAQGTGGGAATPNGAPGPAGPLSPLGNGGLPGQVTDLYQLGFDATWEIDVFGGVRRSLEAAGADTQAAIEEQRDITLSLLAEVARDYIALRGFQREEKIAAENLATQRDTLDLTLSRFQNGFVTDLDVARQKAQVSFTEATLPPLQAQERQEIHALGILMGEDPDALSEELSVPEPIPPVPPEVPIGLPSDLLRRRPDIRRAERQLAAATARIGVATADLFPKFTLTGSMGLDATQYKRLFDYNSRYYELVPGVSWDIFDAGRVQGNIRVQNELQQQALANYQESVLDALRDVEDALVAYRSEQTRRAALVDAVNSSRDAVAIAHDQYDKGVTDFLTVLDAERSLLQAEDQLAQSERMISDNLVALYKALGGGWEAAEAQRS